MEHEEQSDLITTLEQILQEPELRKELDQLLGRARARAREQARPRTRAAEDVHRLRRARRPP